jgi:hypothetical protein
MSIIFVRKGQALPGKEFEAIKWAFEIAKLTTEISGIEVTVVQQIGGPVGQIGWRSIHDSLATFETARNKVLSNERFIKSVAEYAARLFIPGTGHDEVWSEISVPKSASL